MTNIRQAIILTTVFCVGLVGARNLRHGPAAPRFVSFARFGGEELSVFYFASSTCSACNDPKMLEAFPRVAVALAQQASAKGARLSLTGVGIDPNPKQSLRYFDKIDVDFNELIVGRNWSNSAALRYLWGEFPGEPATPQLLVMARRLSDPSNSVVSVLSERVLLRIIGVDKILRWLASDTPMPDW